MRKKIRFLITLMAMLSTFVFMVSCSDDDEGIIQPQNSTLTLSFTGLEDLGTSFMYEGWIIVNGSPVSTGTFSVNSSGVPSKTTFTVSTSDLEAATKFILTIEPSPDTDSDPAATHLVAGDFSGSSATLTIADGAALGNDLTSAAGSYILNTPSTASDDTDFSAGIW